MRDAKYVRIDCEGRFAESDGEHDARGLSPHPGKRFELLSRLGYTPGMLGDKSACGADDVLCFRSKKPARLNQSLDIGEARCGQCFRRRISGEERRRRKIDTCVSTLRRENDGDQQFVRVTIGERRDGVRIGGFEQRQLTFGDRLRNFTLGKRNYGHGRSFALNRRNRPADEPATMKGEREVDDVAVIGGGLAGAAVAIACARFARHARLRLFSPEEPGRGAAYREGSPIWFMNGPARAMSVVAGDPGHLVRTLRCDPNALLPRKRFGDYVRESLRIAIDGRMQVRVERTAVVDLDRAGDGFILTDARNRRYRAHTVVLALGNARPADNFLPRELLESARYFGDPWRTETNELPTGDMLCIGRGLTAMDRVAAYSYAEHRGTAFTLARHAYLPAREVPAIRACNYRALNIDERSPLSLMRSVRAAMRDNIAAGGDWREVAEALRQPSQRIWLGWTSAQRRQFLERLAPLWGSLRYRVPAATEDAVIALRRAGRYVPIQGEIVAASDEADGIRIAYRSGSEQRSLIVASVVNCTGPNGDLALNPDPLVRALLRRGIIRRDSLGLGIDATPYGEAIDDEGLIDERLLALGPMLRGVLYESTAVPEIVEQARAIAERIARNREEWVA